MPLPRACFHSGSEKSTLRWPPTMSRKSSWSSSLRYSFISHCAKRKVQSAWHLGGGVRAGCYKALAKATQRGGTPYPMQPSVVIVLIAQVQLACNDDGPVIEDLHNTTHAFAAGRASSAIDWWRYRRRVCTQHDNMVPWIRSSLGAPAPPASSPAACGRLEHFQGTTPTACHPMPS